MSKQEYVNVVTIKTDKSEKTIKALRKSVTDLKKDLEKTVIGTEDFENASKELAAAQNELKSALDSAKKKVEAADGSYDAMVQTMSELKKEWRATNDEAKRSEIGAQIEKINNELKELDATIGNNQRKVGDYKGEIKAAFNELSNEGKSYGEVWSDVQKSTEQTRGKFESVQKTAAGLASGFGALQGITALLGSENENLEKTMVKVMAAMSVAQGIGGLKDLYEGVSQAKVAFQGLTDNVKLFGKSLTTFLPVALFAALAAGVLALVGNMDKLKQRFTNLTPEQKQHKALADFNVEISKTTAEASADKIVRLKQLADGYKALGDNADAKKKYVQEFAGELNDMGIAMGDVNDADQIFINKTDDYVTALMKRAQAQAIQTTAIEDYKKYLEERAILEAELVDAENKKAAGTPDKTFWENLGEAIVGASVYEGANVDDVRAFNDAWTDEIAQRAVDEANEKLQKLDEDIETKLREKFEQIADLNIESGAYLNFDNKDSNTTTTTTTTTTTSEKSAPIVVEKMPSVGVLEGLDVELKMQEAMWAQSRENIYRIGKESLEKWIAERRKKAEEERAIEIQNEKLIKNAKLDIASSVLGSMTTILGEETAAGKAAAVAQATINTYQAANAAYSSMAGIPIVGPALGAAAAVAAVIAGVANVKQILKTSPDGSNASSIVNSGRASVSPNINMNEVMPIQYTRELMTDTETTNLNKEQRVYVLESDITETQDNVAVKEANSSF